ncbi:MAG: non-ribosomal peptide synthetase, partial [bacterium]|nr:non-ribosomal peptide synthetase [bacterium]
RGFRIELGEIEHGLARCPGVEQAVVTEINKDHQKELAAWIVNKPGMTSQTTGTYREHLGKFLPHYMIPSYFVILDALPCTPSGKTDRKALSLLPVSSAPSGRNDKYSPPGDETEKTLALIWQDVLGLEKIGLTDNFFQLGGHSLRAIRIVSRILKDLSTEIRVGAIFSNPTIRSLARFVKQKKLTAFVDIRPVEEKEYYEVSNAQRRLWLLHQFEEERNAYNIPNVYSLNGELHINALEKAFRRLIRRHDILRTGFSAVSGLPRQRVCKSVEFAITLHPVEAQDPGHKESLAQGIIEACVNRNFDLSAPPLLEVALISFPADPRRHILIFNIHHIVSDTWSMNIIFRELNILYRRFTLYTGSPGDDDDPLHPLSIQYKDYAHWQNRYVYTPAALKQRDYWLRQLAGELLPLEFPTDYHHPLYITYEGRKNHHVIDEKTVSQLKTLCRRQGTTSFMVLSTILNVLIYRYTGQEDIIIGTPVADREHITLEDQVGFYVNTL